MISYTPVPGVFVVVSRQFGYSGLSDLELRQRLSREEMARFYNLPTEERKSEFFSGRVLLREMLSEKLAVAPKDVPIAISASGRPYLTGSTWKFSLSHSAGFVTVAVAKDFEIGIDFEDSNMFAENPPLFNRFKRLLCGAEQPSISLDSLACTKIWCMSEAFAKCWDLDLFTCMRSNEFWHFLRGPRNSEWLTGERCSIWLPKIIVGRYQLAICTRVV